MKVDFVMDIESEGWDKFVVGCLYSASGDFWIDYDPDRFADRVYRLPAGSWAWAHAGGRYDFLFLFSRRRVPGTRVYLSGSAVSRIAIPDGPVLADSYRLVPMRLSKASEIGGIGKSEVGLPCRCGKSCGGYCSIRRGMGPRERSRVETYLRRDCEALLATLLRITDYAGKEGIILKPTIGSSAWATARAWLDLPPASIDGAAYDFLRRGYYGGRTEVGRTECRRGWRYDIRSSYPAALVRTPVPLEETARHRDDGSADYAAGKEGVYEAAVSVGNRHAPPLPLRGASRVWYPTGRFRGTWTRLELAAAESRGARVERISRAITFSETVSLAPFSRRIWDLRDKAAHQGAEALGTWLKLFANSLTGKFAQNPISDSAVLLDPADTPDGEGWRWAGPGVWYRSHRRLPSCGHVVWAAYLTASARIELLDQILEAGEDWIYSDTDSVFSAKPITRRVGTDLGDWSSEGEFRDFQALAPKVYRYSTREKAVVRAKGLSGIDDDGFRRLAGGGSWTASNGVTGFRTACRAGKFFVRAEITRRLNPAPGLIGGRVLVGRCATRPPTIEEVTKHEKGRIMS